MMVSRSAKARGEPVSLGDAATIARAASEWALCRRDVTGLSVVSGVAGVLDRAAARALADAAAEGGAS